MNWTRRLKYNDPTYIHPVTLITKRAVDILIAMLGLVVFAPVMALIALTVVLDSPGGVFYRQIRVGRVWPDRAEFFHIVKFRSMYANAESITGPVWAAREDPRITRVGRFLRKMRLDELPQFVNVLRGDMSIVGPRPERPSFHHRLEIEIPFYTERTYGISPGITGLAQIYQGYDNSIDDVRSKVRYDHAYAVALTGFFTWFRMDLFIAVQTLKIVLFGRGQ
ncbi:MAG: sugar transferase [Pseudomonadota bacterium]|nr:sugar transferase [Pseudomonadota bacterium]